MKTLLTETIKLVNQSELSVTQIAKGAKVKYRWLKYVLDGTFKDPGVNRIERVYNFLSGKPYI